MRINPLEIKKEIDALCNRIHGVSSLTEYSKLCLSIQNLIAVYNTLTANMMEFRIPINQYFENLLKKEDVVGIYRRIKNYEESIEDHVDFSKSVLKVFNATEFIAYKRIHSQNKISDNKAIELLKSFFSYYDEKLYRLFMQMKNGSIDVDGIKHFETDSSYYIPSLNKTYIVTDKTSNIEGISTIIHEMGHAYSYDALKESYKQSRNSDNSIYNEAFSMFLELAFMEYLIKNRILENDAVYSENDFYRWIRSSFHTLYEMSTLEEELEIEEIELIDNSLIYSYGGMIALEMLENFNINDKEEKARIKRFLMSQGIVDQNESLNILGVDMDDMRTCKVLRKRLLNHNKNIKDLNKH